MLALDPNAPDIVNGSAPEPPEPARDIVALPTGSERYRYQPNRMRFVGLVLVTTLHMAILLAFLTWHVAIRTRPPSAPMIVTLLPLMSPARLKPKPAPQQKLKQISRQPPLIRPEQPPLNAPAPAAHPSLMPLPAALTAATPVPSPSVMPVTKSVPETGPSSTPTRSEGKDSWEARVLARLERLKRFPSAARSRRDQGVAVVRFRVNRQGRLLSSSLERSSGSRPLDQEALATVSRAEPFPPIPAGRPDEIDLVVPIEFFLGMRRNS